MPIRELFEGETHLAHRAMCELRGTFADDVERFVTQVDARQRPGGYRLIAAFVDGEPDAVAVAGFRDIVALGWGHVLYIDDLSTRASYRRRGLGQALLDTVLEEAVAGDCEAVHLDSGHHRYEAHRLYLAAGFEIRSHHLVHRLQRAGPRAS